MRMPHFFVCKRHSDDCNSFGFVTLIKGLSGDVMQRYLSVKVLINIHGMTSARFHKKCLKRPLLECQKTKQ